MKSCKTCIHYKLCEYSTIADIEVTCKDWISNTIVVDTVRKMQGKLKKAFANTMIIRDVHNNEPNMDSDDVWDAIDQIAKELLEEENDV